MFLVLHFLLVCTSFNHILANFEQKIKRIFFGYPCSRPLYKKELFLQSTQFCAKTTTVYSALHIVQSTQFCSKLNQSEVHILQSTKIEQVYSIVHQVKSA